MHKISDTGSLPILCLDSGGHMPRAQILVIFMVSILTLVFSALSALAQLDKTRLAEDDKMQHLGELVDLRIARELREQKFHRALSETVNFSADLVDSNLEYVSSALWSGVKDVRVIDGYAYCSFVNGLVVVDVSDSTNPSFVNKLHLPDADFSFHHMDIDPSGDYIYLPTGLGLYIINITDKETPHVTSNYQSGKYCNAVCVQDSFAFLLFGNNEIQALDISDKTNPQPRGHLAVKYWASDLCVRDSLAYVISGFLVDTLFVSVIDHSNKDSLHTVASFTVDTGQVILPLDAHLSGDYIYVTTLSALDIVDVKDPDSLHLEGRCDSLSALSVFASGNVAYVTAYPDSFWIVDVSDPENPAPRGGCDVGEGYGVTHHENIAYVANWADGLAIVAVSDPDNPSLVGEYVTPNLCYDVQVANGYAFTANGTAGLQVVDVLDETNPQEVGEWVAPELARAVFVLDTLAYVADYYQGLQIVDVSDPAAPESVGSVGTWGNPLSVFVSGDYAYMAEGASGLEVIDVADPQNPGPKGRYDTPAYATKVFVVDTIAYVADRDSGLQIVNVSNPLNPTRIGVYDATGFTEDVFVRDTLAYVVGENGLHILSVADPSDPRLLGSSLHSGHDIYAAGDYVYMAWSSSVYLLDVSNPLDIQSVGRFETHAVVDVFALGGHVYVANGYSLTILKQHDLPPRISHVCPARVSAVNSVDITIAGYHFRTGLSVKLSKYGIPTDTISGSDVQVRPTNHDLLVRFDLTGQNAGTSWDLIVTNPNGMSDTLMAALTIAANDQLSPEDVLCVLSTNHNRIEDFQANAKAVSKFNGEPQDSIVHSVSLYKAPDKVKHVDYDNEDTTQVISAVINRGWMQYETDPATDEILETNFLKDAQMTPGEFAGLNFYDPNAFMFHHYVTIKNIYEHPDSLVFVLEAIPKRAEWTYSKLELGIDYSRGVVARSTVYPDSVERQSTVVTEQQFQGGIWLCTKLIKTTVDTSETLETAIELSNIQINAGIPDSSFELPAGKAGTEETEPDTTLPEFEVSPLLGRVSDLWDNPNVYKPNPLLFLHGFAKGSPESWENTMQKFREYMNPYHADDISWYVYCPNFQIYPGSNASIDNDDGWGYATCSEIVGRLINFNPILEEYRPQKVNIVAHSMGGLGARECVTGGTEFPDMHTKVQKLITTGTPHLGSRFANIGKQVVAHEKRAGLAVTFFPSWRISTAMQLLAAGLFDIDLGGEAVEDMSIGSLFLDNLYARDQHEHEISYYAIAGVLFGFGDGVVSRKSQLGEGEPGGHNFYQYLQQPFGTAEIMAHHLNEPTESFSPIRSFLDPRPSVLIASPQPDDEIADACTLRIELHYEYLPAHTQLFVTMTKLDEPSIADFEDLFRPDTSWRSQGMNSMKSGRYDTTISISQAPAGKYVIEVKVRNPAGYEDEASVEITIGVDLVTQIAGGQARRGMNKVYGISYSNIGTAEASDVLLETVLDPRTDYVSSTPPGNPVGNTVSWDIGSLAAGEAGHVLVTAYIPWSVPQWTVLDASASITSTDEDVDTSNNTSRDPEEVVGSYDPNDKVVNPEGIGVSGYIHEGQTLRYAVYFENDSAATAEAIDVVVVDTLDPNLDWNSLAFGPMSHPDRCSPSFDPVGGVITWECDSIMLPPNDNPPEGEGWFTFSIDPQYLPHGTEIKNRASIQFDNNPWIYAPMDSTYVVNTVDEYAPSSRVAALWDTVASLNFEVNWRGSDDSLGFGSGIKWYTIYVSDDGGITYGVWIAETSDTSATFSGQPAYNYCFYSVAEDSVGNIEEPPPLPDACTAAPTYICGDTNGDGAINVGDVVYLVAYLYRNGPAPNPSDAGDANCDGAINVGDVVYLVSYLYKGGPPPGCP